MRLKRAGLLTKLVIVVLLVYLATSLLDLRGQIQSVQEERDTLEQQVEEQRLANQQLEDAIENSDDPETLERVAREMVEGWSCSCSARVTIVMGASSVD